MTSKKPREKVRFIDVQEGPMVRDARAQAWHDLFEQLREKPNSWAIIKEYEDERHAYDAYNRLRKYKDSLLPNGVWQLKSQKKMVDGLIEGSILMARFVEESDTPEMLKAIKGRVASSAYDNDKDAVSFQR